MMKHHSMNRGGFTLTELMVSIVIIAILSSVTLYAMANVQTQAKVQRQKAQIAKIHELLIERWESYEERIPDITYPNGLSGRERALVRLSALRELMKMEMPDRISDVTDLGPYTGNVSPTRPTIHRPTLNRYYASFASGHVNGGIGNWSTTHQDSECLYMILSRIEVADASALEMFSETEIGDTDSDGMPEILDAWGRPLNFLRWAPGFSSPMQRSDADLDGDVDAADILASKDTFDYAQIDPRTSDVETVAQWSQTFALVPLVFSSGADGISNIRHDIEIDGPGTFVVYRLTGYSADYNREWKAASPGPLIHNDPFVFIYGNLSDPVQLGDVTDSMSDGNVDNIYNHLIETSNH